MKRKTLFTLLSSVLIGVVVLAAPLYTFADCTQASLIWSQDYATVPTFNAVCSSTVTTNCYVRFVIVDPDPVTGGSVPVPITSLPSPLAVVDGITSGFFKANHAVGTSYTFSVFVEYQNAAGVVMRTTTPLGPNPGNVVVATCGTVTPPTAPPSPSGVVVVTR